MTSWTTAPKRTSRAKPDQEDALLAHLEAWDRQRRPKVHGFLGGEVYRDLVDRRHFINIARFESPEAAQAVAGVPEQDAWYRRLVELCEAEPIFTDCDLAWQA
jgi:antibiotic biosynthesis monooxygenase (ABM) superfamily enzyme